MSDTGGLSVGTLSARLDIDTSALRRDMSDVDRAMQGTAHRAEESAHKASAAWGTVGKALGGLAIAKFGIDSVKAYGEAEQSAVRLQDAFSRFPKLGDSSADAIGKIATALATKSRFDDDAISSGATILAQFGLTGKTVEAALPHLVDYAARTGKDIPTAAAALQKAALGSTKPLKELGITGFKATGDRARDMATVLELVGQKTSGFADKDVHTVEGSLAQLSNRFGEVQEAVGGALVPILTTATPIIGKLADSAQKGATWFAALPGPMQSAALAIGGIMALAKVGLFTKLSAGFATFRGNIATLRAANTVAGVAGTGMSRFGAAARVAGSAVGSLGKGLMGAFGGPIGLALVGITAAIGIFQSANEKSRAAVEAHNAAVEEFSKTLNQTTGALTAASLGVLTDQLKEGDAAFKAAGSSVGSMAAAVSKGGSDFYAAQQKLIDFNKAAIENKAATNQSGQYIDIWAKKFGISADAIKQAAVRGGDAQIAMIGTLGKQGISADNAASTMNNYRKSIEDLVPGLKLIDDAQSVAATGTKNTAKAFDDLALAAAKAANVKAPEALVAGLDKAASSAATAGKTVESALGALGVHGKAANDIIAALGDKLVPAGDHAHYFSQAAADIATSTEGAAKGVDKVGTAAKGATAPTEDMKKALDGISSAATDADTASQFLQATLDRLAGRNQSAADAMHAEEAALRGIAKASRDEAAAKDDVVAKQQALTEARSQGVDKDHTAADNALALRKAERDLADAQDTVKEKTNSQADANLAAARAIEQQVSATAQATLRTKGLSAAANAGAAKMATLRGQFVAAQVASGQSTKAAEKLADAYGLIPANVRTAIIAENSASPKIADVSRDLAKLPLAKQIEILAHNDTPAGIAAAIAAFNALPRSRNISVSITVSMLGDPTAIAYARAHGISTIGAPHFALGGAIMGGVAGQDSVPLLGMPGEHMLTTRDVDRLGGQGGVYRFRQQLAAGRVGKYASGGGVPGGAALAGFPAFQPGEREGNVGGALADLASAVADFAASAADARSAAAEAKGKLGEAKANQRQTSADQAGKVADVKHSNTEKLKTAEDGLNAARHRSAKTAAQQTARHDAIVKAEQHLAKVRHDNAAALGAATAAQRRANVAAANAVHTANRQSAAASRTAATLTHRAAVEADVQRREAGMRRMLTSLGRQYDQNASKVANLTDKLSDLQGKAADTTNSIAGNVTGIGGGILGADSFGGSSTNPADIIKSLQGNLKTAKSFDANIAKLVALGLNPAQAEKVANADVEGRGGVVASALAGASKGQIAQINSLLAQQAGVGTTTGKRVATAEYGAEIHATDVQIKATQLNMKIEAAEAARIGNTIAAATRAAMTGQRVTITIGAKELNAVIASVVKTEHSAEVRHAAGR
jgi:hypothetical protein